MEQFVQVLALIISLALAILVGKDASKRGMNPWGWGIGVFILWIIFLPLYFIVRSRKHNKLIKCPKCGISFESPVIITTKAIYDKYGENLMQCPKCNYSWIRK